jgi:Glyoxalase/Bleomycin resistance protein/Dioxygenase superfamily
MPPPLLLDRVNRLWGTTLATVVAKAAQQILGYVERVTLIRPRNFHRLALAVYDVDSAAAWLDRFVGAVPIGRAAQSGSDAEPSQERPGRDLGNMAGTDTRLFWVGGYPVILLTGGAVARFLERRGPGVQSFAWEVDDNWAVEHIVRDNGIEVISVNIAGRFFFMHPSHTHGLLLEWCDGKMPRESLPASLGGGLVDHHGLAWVSGVVTDADATSEWMASLMEVKPVEGNPMGPPELERTVDLLVGDITVRLITPISPDSRYAPMLARGPGVHSFAVRVPDLDAALASLDAEGIGTIYRAGGLAATDPAATLGLRIEWSE